MSLHLHRDGGVMVMPQRPGVVGVAALVHGPQMRPVSRRHARGQGGRDPRALPVARVVRAAAAARAPLRAVARTRRRATSARGAALIGDAVHVTNPTAGQGMTMAIEDARGADPPRGAGCSRPAPTTRALDAALAAYERERRPANDEPPALVALHGALLRDARGRRRPSCARACSRWAATPFGQWIQRRVWSRVATRPGRRHPATPRRRRPSLAMEPQP